jgi:hypothetical protein
MAKARFIPVVAACGLTAACGSNSLPSDCSWFLGNPCWQQALAAASACFISGTGVLSADGKGCVYASGTSVSFSPAVQPSTFTIDPVSFSIDSPQKSPCMSYAETWSPKQLTLVTSAGTFRMSTGVDTATITCPDSTSYSASSFDLLGCGNLNQWPGTVTAADNNTVAFAFSALSPSIVPAFVCCSQ